MVPISRGRRCSPPASAAKPDARFGQREHGGVGRDDQIAGQRDFETAAHRDAVHRRDHRLVEVEAAGETAKAAAGMVDPRSAGRGDLQIVAGAEGALARARHDRDPLFRVGGEIVEDLGKFDMRRRVQRVHDFGPVERDDRQPPFALDLAELVVRHGVSPCFSRQVSRLRARLGKAWVTI